VEIKSKKVMSHGVMVGRSSVEVSQSNGPLFPLILLQKKVMVLYYLF